MKRLNGPQTQVAEGIYAIKVSMSCSQEGAQYLNPSQRRTDQLGLYLMTSSDYSEISEVLRIRLRRLADP